MLYYEKAPLQRGFTRIRCVCHQPGLIVHGSIFAPPGQRAALFV